MKKTYLKRLSPDRLGTQPGARCRAWTTSPLLTVEKTDRGHCGSSASKDGWSAVNFPQARFWGASEFTIRELIGFVNTRSVATDPTGEPVPSDLPVSPIMEQKTEPGYIRGCALRREIHAPQEILEAWVRAQPVCPYLSSQATKAPRVLSIGPLKPFHRAVVVT